MTDAERDKLRAKQDVLVAYCTPKYPGHYRISASELESPTVDNLREFIYPEWEWLIDQQIELAKDSIL